MLQATSDLSSKVAAEYERFRHWASLFLAAWHLAEINPPQVVTLLSMIIAGADVVRSS